MSTVERDGDTIIWKHTVPVPPGVPVVEGVFEHIPKGQHAALREENERLRKLCGRAAVALNDCTPCYDRKEPLISALREAAARKEKT